MPNWRKADDYAFAEQHFSPHDWAWEFLRRNEDYRTAWEELQNATDQLEQHPEAPGVAARVNKARKRSGEFGLLDFRDPKWSARVASTDPFTPSPNWLGAVGVIVLVDQILDGFEPGLGTWPGYPQSIALSFSFSMPIEPQIMLASRLLREYSRRAYDEAGIRPPKPKIRFNPARFTLYLRVLDARQDGEKTVEIARALFGDKAEPGRSARDALAAARKMITNGYRDLLLMANL
jgi:hypothetical protein